MITVFDLYFDVHEERSDNTKNECNAFHPTNKLKEIRQSYFYIL